MKYKVITHSYVDAIKVITNGLTSGNPILDKIHCAYITNEENIIHIANAFELADLDLPIDSIKSFTLAKIILCFDNLILS